MAAIRGGERWTERRLHAMPGNIEEQSMRLDEISTRTASVENGIADHAAATAELARRVAVLEARPQSSAPPSGFTSCTASTTRVLCGLGEDAGRGGRVGVAGDAAARRDSTAGHANLGA